MISFMPSLLAGLAALLPVSTAIPLDINSPSSIKGASSKIAYGLMSLYQNNQTDTPKTAIGTLQPPLYWWEAGAVWGGLIDYWAYTDDSTYVPTVTQALLAQTGPDNNFMPPAYFSSLGNDDQAFWAFAALSAVEYGFPTPAGNSTTVWLDLAEAVFNTMVPRFETSTCGGGLRWQIFSSNKGYDYKNTISNGGFFQIAARLARYSGNQTYLAWAEKTWDWMETVGLIDPSYNVYDGGSVANNCSNIAHEYWSYNSAVLLYGSAMLYNHTNGAEKWANRTQGLLKTMGRTYFSPNANATNVMFEPSCEPGGNCNNDQLSFKAYVSRWMAKSTVVMPELIEPVTQYLNASALAAAQSCSGGSNGQACGEKWYVGRYDGTSGVGQELAALETVQSLLLLDGTAARRAPLSKGQTKADSVSKWV